MEMLAWVPWLSPMVAAVIAWSLFAAAARRARAATTVHAARSLRRGAIALLLACGVVSYAALYVLLREPGEDAYLEVLLPFVASAWWGMWSGIAITPWLGQRSDLDMTSSVRATRAGLTLLFALGLGGLGAVVGAIAFFAVFFCAAAVQ
jgi:hypothetical protein